MEKRENQPYDVVRQALKEVGLDSAGRVESEDYVGVSLAYSLSIQIALITSHS